MTIQVTIKNADSRETAVIEVVTLDPRSGFQNNGGKQRLKGGESADFYVHSVQSLEIKEISQ